MSESQKEFPSTHINETSEDEISIKDILDFFVATWKKLIIAAVVGGLLGLGYGVFALPYSGEYVLINSGFVDLLGWKNLQKTLPNLALQISESGKITEPDATFYKRLASETWWSKNVQANYALSKTDTKELANVSKDLDLASTTILSLTINTTGTDKQDAINTALKTAEFMRQGSTYLQLRSLINNYEITVLTDSAGLNTSITTIQVELSYQFKRLEQLEILYKRFPGSATDSGSSIFDPKDSGAKYLPLRTQIIAANQEINDSKENLNRLRRQLVQLEVMRVFVDQAQSLLAQSFDGLNLLKQLIKLESDQRKVVHSADDTRSETLDQIHATLSQYDARFNKGWETTTSPSASKKGMTMSVAAGFFGAFFLMMIALLAQRAWVRVKSM